ncbi:MAG: hypothetical protein JKX98_01030 [Alcanivoracaceae bacterium]|nr:hypothetical protein [Alcanivoracaceae bacterium]
MVPERERIIYCVKADFVKKTPYYRQIASYSSQIMRYFAQNQTFPHYDSLLVQALGMKINYIEKDIATIWLKEANEISAMLGGLIKKRNTFT